MKLPKLGFGTCRLILASMVAMSHLWDGMIQGYAAYAVWAFFVLSGFLMTLVLTTRYGFDGVGLRAYAFNRFMRIFPLYWIAAAVGLVTLWFSFQRGIDLRQINAEFYWPGSAEQWLHVVSLFPGFQRGGLPVPVSNALAIEVGFYMLLPFMARARSTAWLALLVGIILNLRIGIVGDTFGERYATFLPCILPFAAGALACHYREALSRFSMPLTSVLVWLLYGLTWLVAPNWPWTFGLYVSVLLSVWMVVSLHRQPSSAADRLLGDMSYPVYLFHTTVAAWFLCPCDSSRPLDFFFKAFAVTLVLSLVIVYVIDRPLAKLKLKAPRDRAVVGHSGPAPESR
ncbi:MAG: acyltransferase family protein [Stenotrophomonas sp.]|uniref:acyltransferase family protein n=1 Tax=Stenotrophomonas sp. TaxID=69392 RepID=UPI003D6CDEC1